CYNRGFDGRDVQWECKADLDERFRFGGFEVNCEGYEYPDDPYVTAGSCGLEYKVYWTAKGRKARDSAKSKSHSDSYSSYTSDCKYSIV
ncbi:Store-operated calcium entry-associated regulatory factor, partial [Irineochytrium annulatum]